jgi:hypothetical protein
MVHWCILCLFWLIPAIISYTPDTGLENAVFQHLDSIPPGWLDDGRPSATCLISFKIAFSDHRHQIHTDEHVIAGSASYGRERIVVQEEGQKTTAADRMVIEMTYDWLHQNSISNRQIANYGRWLRVQLTVAQAEHLLDTDIRIFKREQDGLRRVGTLAYSIPASLHQYIKSVHPTADFDASGRSKDHMACKSGFFDQVAEAETCAAQTRRRSPTSTRLDDRGNQDLNLFPTRQPEFSVPSLR